MKAGNREIDPAPVNIEVNGQTTIGLRSNNALVATPGKVVNSLNEQHPFSRFAAVAEILFKSTVATLGIACHL